MSTRLVPAATTTEVDYTAIDDATRNVIIAAYNPNRVSLRIVNRSSQTVRMREGAPATRSLYSWLLPPLGEVTLDYPSCAQAIYGHFGALPDGRIFVTERS